MANPNPHNQWQAGQSGNPNGRPRLPADLKVVTKLSPSILKALIDKLANTPIEELVSMKETGAFNKMGLLEAGVVAVWMKAIQEGDHNRLEWIINRSRIGKVKEQLDVNLIPKVTFTTNMTEDGRLIRDIIKEGLDSGDDDTEGSPEPSETAQP